MWIVAERPGWGGWDRGLCANGTGQGSPRRQWLPTFLIWQIPHDPLGAQNKTDETTGHPMPITKQLWDLLLQTKSQLWTMKVCWLHLISHLPCLHGCVVFLWYFQHLSLVNNLALPITTDTTYHGLCTMAHTPHHGSHTMTDILHHGLLQVFTTAATVGRLQQKEWSTELDQELKVLIGHVSRIHRVACSHSPKSHSSISKNLILLKSPSASFLKVFMSHSAWGHRMQGH